MPTTIEITAYKFQELTDRAKQEVITRLAPDYQWWDHIYDHAKELGEAKGFRIDDINFSGFYSQGDGASWVGMVDTPKWIELNKADETFAQILLELIENGWVSKQVEIVNSNSRYSHSNTMNHRSWEIVAPLPASTIEEGIFKGAPVDELFTTIGYGYLDSLLVDMLDDARSFADDIYKMLRDEYDWMCSEEYIAELCDANEYLFDENGKFV
jgi:hypothetical protein